MAEAKKVGVEELFLLPDERKAFWEKAYLAAMAEGIRSLPPGLAMLGAGSGVATFAEGSARAALAAYDRAWSELKQAPAGAPVGKPDEEEEPRYLGQ